MAESLLKEPNVLLIYWDFVESLSDKSVKSDAKLTLAPLMASETNFQEDQRNELIGLVLSTQTADVDAAVGRLLCTPRYRDRIFDQNEIFRAHLIRCGQFSDFGIKFHLEPAYQNIFWNEKATSVFKEADNSRWLLSEYLPSLSPAIRQIALGALCSSPRVVPTWGEKPFMATLLALVDDQSDADIRARTVAASLRFARFDNVLDDDPKLPFATLFRDESLPDTARAIFIAKITDNQSYLDWLHQSDQVDAFIDTVEHFVRMPDIDLTVLNAKHGYVQLLIEKNRMESWFINLERSESAKTNGLVMLTAKADFLTPEVLETNWERILLLINTVEEPNQRGKYLAAFLLSQHSLQLHQRKRRIGELLRQIETQENSVVQDALLRSLPRPEVMREIAASKNERELVELIRALPLEKKSSAISLVVNPVMLKYLSQTEQIDFLVEMISLQPSGSNIYTDPAVADLLIHHRYLDRFFDQARTNLESDGLAAKLLASPSTVSYFQKENRLKDLVALFERLEAGGTRDTAIGSLFEKPELAVAVCKEIGIEKCLSMIDTIHCLFSRSNARANAVIASCEIEKSTDERLNQLLSDIRNCGIVDAPRRQSILQGAVGQQLITAGLLPQVKELFLATRRTRDKRLEKPLDDYYSSVLVLKHLDENGSLDEFQKHTRSIRDLQEVFEFTNRLLDSNEGRQILLSSRGFPILASLVENMEAYGQHIFWMDFCGKLTIVEYVAQSNEADDMIRYLFNRNDVKSEVQKLVVRLVDGQHLERVVENKLFVTCLASNLSKLNASIRSMLALNLSRSPNAIYKLVQSGQFDALVSIIESEQVDGLRSMRWRSVAGLEGSLVSSLISLGQGDRVNVILTKSAESDWHRAWIDLWVRASCETISDDIKKMEGNPGLLQEGQWRWLSWAHRAQGNDAQATEAAKKINAHSFQTAVAIEHGDWPGVALLLSKSPAPHAYIQPQGDDAMAAEHQGMLLVARLFAGHQGELRSPIDALADLRSKTNDRKVRLRCIDSLLLGEQFETTLRSFDQSTVDRAVRINFYQGNYAATIAVAGWNPQDPQAFVASIRESSGSDALATELTTRLLSAFFHTGKFHDMRLLHDAQIKFLRDNSRVLSDNQNLRKYLVRLHQFGLEELFWSAIEMIDPMSLLHIGLLTDDSPDPVDQALRSHLPRLAYQAARKDAQTTDQEAVIAAYRIAAQAYRLTSIPKGQLDAWVDLVTVSSETGNRLSNEAIAVGIVCLRHGRIDDAKRILIPLEENHWVASLVLARDAWKRKDWDQAAVHYERLYRNSRARIEGLFFSGLAISRSGKVEEGEAAMAMARKAAFHPRTLLQMGVESLKIGEAEIGKVFFEKVVRLALPHDPAQREAIGHLKTCASSPEEVIRWSQQWQMLQARYYYGYGDQAELLEVPWAMQGAMAEQAFANEEWPAVDRALKVCFEIKPGETKFFDGWIERLDKAGQIDLVKAWNEKSGAQAALNDSIP